MRTYNLYADNDNKILAAGTSRTMAWALIRNECHRRNIPVPTMDKIHFLRELSEEETKALKHQSK